jgi:hypothetical protein
MHKQWVAIAALGLLVGSASSGFAQRVAEPLVLSHSIPIGADDLRAPSLPAADPGRAAELQAWLDEFVAWQDWAARWRGQREPGWLTSFRARRERPSPPAWLSDRCVTVLDESDPLMPACTRLAEWREADGAARIRAVRVAATTGQEAEPRTTWWEHIHMDLLWPAMQWQASVYGVVGMHVTTTVRGRWQVFTAPGVVMLNLPARDGTRVWKVAANYGIGYRLANFTFPGGRPAELHVNLAKTWLLSDPADSVTGRSIDLLGFSITFKKER